MNVSNMGSETIKLGSACITCQFISSYSQKSNIWAYNASLSIRTLVVYDNYEGFVSKKGILQQINSVSSSIDVLNVLDGVFCDLDLHNNTVA